MVCRLLVLMSGEHAYARSDLINQMDLFGNKRYSQPIMGYSIF